MTSASEAARTLLVEQLVLDELKAANVADREAAAMLLDVGDKKVASFGDVPLGKIELRDGGADVEVDDRAALLAWVRDEHPGMLTTAEDLTPLTEAIMAAQRGRMTADQRRLVVDAAYRLLGRLTAEQSRTGVLSSTAERALLKNIADNRGVRVDGETGEETVVPGVSYTPKPPKIVVTPERKKGAPELVRELLAGGSLPALPAIEPPTIAAEEMHP